MTNAYAAKAAGYLGLMHLRAEGVDVSAERAYLWFRRVAEMGDMMSQNGLGDIYLKGLPSAEVRQSPLKAFEHFRAAAQQDFPPAQVSLAKVFLEQLIFLWLLGSLNWLLDMGTLKHGIIWLKYIVKNWQRKELWSRYVVL